MARTLKKQQHKQDNSISDNHAILDGMAHVFRVARSGDVWQFRMYIKGENKHFRKSLKTRDLSTALSLGRELGLELQGKLHNGVKLFGLSLREFVDEYLAYRERDVAAGIISAGRLVTIKSQLNWVLRLKGEHLKVGELGRDSFFDWRLERREESSNVSDVTIRNETATINALCKWGYRQGYIAFDSFNIRTLSIRQEQVGKRGTFTLEQYDALVLFMRSYVSKKECRDEQERLERLLIRDFVLIASNTLLRVGEARQLTWGDVEKIEAQFEGDKQVAELAYINVRSETSKVRASRKVVSRGGEYFKRLKARQEHTENHHLVFSMDGENKLAARKWQKHWLALMDGIGLHDWKRQKIEWYSLRHFGITCRIQAGNTALEVSKMAGTSISHIENTYLKYSEEMARSAALKNFKVSKDGLVVRD